MDVQIGTSVPDASRLEAMVREHVEDEVRFDDGTRGARSSWLNCWPLRRPDESVLIGGAQRCER
jgi:hypothetical protein